MAATYQRVFCRPEGLSDEQLARWEQALAGAISLQRQLGGASPYILQLLGDLEPSPEGFCVRHEPAEPLLHRLYDPDAPVSEPPELLRTAAALLDALRAYHESRQERPPVHGGVCPGILLVTPDGIPKVTDFGIAPAYCTLGEEIYRNLAVRTPDQADEEGVTAWWEVLKPNVGDRDDRLAAFIDPEKYESGRYQAFEAASDVLAAGLVLHLMAEHRHPYLYDDDTAHRKVDVLEFMLPLSLPTRVRRADLLKSEDAALREWCELVAQMVDRSREKRPSAGKVVKALPGINLDDILRARIESLGAALDRDGPIAWDELHASLRPLVEAAAGSPEVGALAGAMAALCEAALLLDTPRWADAEPLLQRAAAQPGPPGLARRAGTLLQRLERSRAAARELQQIQDTMAALSGPAEQQDAQLAEAGKQVARLAAEVVVRPVREQLEQTGQEIQSRREQLAAELRELVAQAQSWLEEANAARDAHDWRKLAALLTAEPAFLTPEAQTGAEQLRAALRAHEEEEEARRRLRLELERCLAEAGELLDRGQLIEAQEKVSRLARPGVDADLAEAAAQLSARIEKAAAERAQREAEILRERARLDESLQEATAAVEGEDAAGLQRARRICQSILDNELATAAQREAAELLVQQIRRRLDELEQVVLSEIETLQRDESRLVESRELLASGKVLEANALTSELLNSKFPHIREQASALAEELAARLESHRQELRAQLDHADALFEAGDFEQALATAQHVWEDRGSDDELRRRAHARKTEAEAELARIAELKAQAERDLNEGLSLLAQAEIAAARACFERADASGHLTSEQRAQLDLVLVSLPNLELAAEMLAEEDYPGALETSLEVEAHSGFELVRQAAGRLAARAREGMSVSLVRGIEKHLEHRAALEDRNAALAEVSPDESLGDASPAWLRSRVGQFETFVQSCSAAERPAREPQLAPGTRLGGKYEIQEFLGRGGMGEVYRAVDLKLKREVALKIAPPQASNAELAAALQNEAEAIASLSHPHIVHINSFDVIDGRPCFDTNYIRGKDLAAYCAESGQGGLTPMQAVTTLIPVCEALAYAHGRGVLHRDIKPQNIYIGSQPGEGPWLIDFGLARMRSICDQRELEGLCGTPGYVAPEVIRSLGREADPRSDVFALGCVLYVLLSGQVPFRARSGKGRQLAGPSRTLLQTLRYQVDPLSALAPGTPEPLRRICERAMAADPAERFQSAREMADALRQFQQELLAEETRSELASARDRFEKRRRETPAELEDLEAAAAIAEQAAKRRIEPVQGEATQLIAQIGKVREEIRAAIAAAGQQLEAAGAALESRSHRAALTAARAVTGNPYVPDLHARAQEIETAALAGVKAQRKRRLAMAGVGTVVAVCVVAGVVLAPRMFGGSKASPSPEPRPPVVAENPKPPVNQPVQQPPVVEPPGDPKPPEDSQPPVTYALVIEPPAGPVRERQSLTLQAGWREPSEPPAGVTYQWYRIAGGTRSPIAGQTSPAFSLQSVAPADAGQYVCVATLNGQEIAQASIELQVTPRQEYQIVLDVEGTIELGADETRTITATLQPPVEPAPTFQWFRLNADDQPEAFRQENPLRLTGADAGTFLCRVITADGEWESPRFSLKLRPTPPPEPKPEPPQPPQIVAFSCEPEGEFVWPPLEIRCTVGFDKPAVLEATWLQMTNCQAAAPIDPAPRQQHTFTLTPTGKDGDTVTVQLAENADRLVIGPNLNTRSISYTIPPAPTIAPAAVDNSASRDASGVFTAARLPVIIDLGPSAAGVSGDGLQVTPPDALKSVEQTRLTLAHPTSEAITVTLKAGALQSASGRPNIEQQFTIRIPAEAPKLLSGLPGPAAVLKSLENVTLQFEKEVAVAPGALKIGNQDVPAAVRQNTVVFEVSKLTGLSGRIEATLDPAKITNAFQRPLVIAPEQTRWTYTLPSAAYLKWFQPRRALETGLLAGLKPGPLGPQAGQVLAAIGAAKWGGQPRTLSMSERTSKLRDPLSGLSSRGRAIQPVIFAEYLWAQNVHVLCWTSAEPDRVEYANLGDADALLAELKSNSATRGQRLLAPVLARLAGAAALLDPQAPTLGIAFGLDGPLWFLHIDELPFQPISFEPAVRLRLVKEVVGRPPQVSVTAWDRPISRLTDLCPPKGRPEGEWYTAIWTMISLTPPGGAVDPAALCAPGLTGIVPEGQAVQSDLMRAARGRLLRLATQSSRAVIDAVGDEDAGFQAPRVLDPAAPIAIVADPVP